MTVGEPLLPLTEWLLAVHDEAEAAVHPSRQNARPVIGTGSSPQPRPSTTSEPIANPRHACFSTEPPPPSFKKSCPESTAVG